MSSPPTTIYVDAIEEWKRKTEEFYSVAAEARERIFGPKASVYKMVVDAAISKAIDEVLRIASLRDSAISFPGPLMATRLRKIDDYTVTLGSSFTIAGIGPHAVMFAKYGEASTTFVPPYVFLTYDEAGRWKVVETSERFSDDPDEYLTGVYASGVWDWADGRRYTFFRASATIQGEDVLGLITIDPSSRVRFSIDDEILSYGVGIIDGETALAVINAEDGDRSLTVLHNDDAPELRGLPMDSYVIGVEGTAWEFVVDIGSHGADGSIHTFYAVGRESGEVRIEPSLADRYVVENGLFAFGEGKLTCLRTEAEVPYEGNQENDTGYRGIFYRSTGGVFFWDADWSTPRRLAGPEFHIVKGTPRCFDGADSRVLVSRTRNLIAFRDTVLPIDLPNGKIRYTIQLGVGQLVVVMKNKRLYYAERHGQVVVTWYAGLGNDAVLINDRRLLVAGILYDEDESRPIEIVRVYDVGASSARSFANTLEQLAAEALADREGKAKLLGDLSIPLSVKGTIAEATLGD